MGQSTDTPVGTWTERFVVDGKEFESILRFTPEGRVFILSGPHPGGGAGTWTPTGDGTFTYRIAEYWLDEHGGYAGWVDVDHRAALTGDTFVSRGTSHMYDDSDRCTVSVPIEGQATRR